MFHSFCSSLNNTPKIDPNHWNSLIKDQAKLKNDRAILFTFSQMENLHILPDSTTLPLILKACLKLHAIETGKRIHSKFKSKNLINDVRVRSSFVDFYGKCGLLEDARHVFDETSQRDVVLWNVMINSYVGCCFYWEALLLFKQMWVENLKPTSVTLVALLIACGELVQLRLGKEIHGFCLRNGVFPSNCYLGAALIGFYVKFDVRASRVVFDLMPMKNVVSWNIMMNAYKGVGDQLISLKLFVKLLIEGVVCDKVSLLAAIQACSELGCLDLGMQLHQLIIKFRYAQDLHIISALVNLYVKTGCLESSCRIFESAPIYDIAIWNSMISACLEYGRHEEAWKLFSRMQLEGFRVNEATMTILLTMCLETGCELRASRSLQAKFIRNGLSNNTSIVNAVLRIYACHGCFNDAMMLFDELIRPDVVSWNIMISALAGNGLKNHAWNYFEKMLDLEIKPNMHTIIAVLTVCKEESYLNLGRSIHGYVMKHGIEVNIELSTALIEMYANCIDEVAARNLFDRCSNRDVILWNSLIASYVRNNLAHEALSLFKRMILEAEPNSITIINILSSCIDVASLPLGQCLHAYTIRKNCFGGLNLSLANALLSMYARCGSMQNAEKIFKSMQRKNISSWNALVAGYGLNGQVTDALCVYSQMLSSGFRPNGRTLLSLLSACSHSGMVEKGLELFKSMVYDFGVTPILVHYGCMVDLLGRAGYVDEARLIIDSMPFEPDASVLRALLSACRAHSKLTLAKVVFQRLVEVEPTNAGNYIMFSNICADAGRWSEVRDLRMHLKEKGLRKNPGISWIFYRDQAHCFIAGDQFCFKAAEVYATLNSLLLALKDDGYIPDLWWTVHEEEDERAASQPLCSRNRNMNY
ncbi:putative pentatricopeptide repeat-containing protein At3g01580 [Chenopodium quinoa]|uniref:putative pentatricopeptide repeat-containing protein At3g01580 n=1 Tax=Chenopodium quinoa TaxID=63459 RepID=UPI000B77EC2F|nr:putative pentatricopeptide repeat-containing protein At3g01580 [Chenopodium quinoa]